MQEEKEKRGREGARAAGNAATDGYTKRKPPFGGFSFYLKNLSKMPNAKMNSTMKGRM